MVALLPAADRLPPAVALDLVPFPVGSSPLFPGPVADTDEGARSAVAVIAATASRTMPAMNMVGRPFDDLILRSPLGFMPVLPRETLRAIVFTID